MINVERALRVKRPVGKPKQSATVEPTFSRGLRNYDTFDIMNDPDDDADGEGNYSCGLASNKTLMLIPRPNVSLPCPTAMSTVISVLQQAIP
jgi:hypothetical protein